MTPLIIGLLFVIVIVIVVCRNTHLSHFEPGGDESLKWLASTPRGDVCSGHCFRNGRGEIMDVWDCCQCKATVTNQYQPNFSKCMCAHGYKDFCYIPVTNLLLSQGAAYDW